MAIGAAKLKSGVMSQQTKTYKLVRSQRMQFTNTASWVNIDVIILPK